MASSHFEFNSKLSQDGFRRRLEVMKQFLHLKPHSIHANAVFSYFYQTMSRHPHLVSFCCGKLRDILTKAPRFCRRTIHLAEAFEDSHLKLELYRELADMLCSDILIHRLLRYAPLIERLLLHPSIPPVKLLMTLQRYLSTTSCYAVGSWEAGNELLSFCRAAMLVHPHADIHGLRSLLLQLSLYHGDVDTRDRAALYMHLFMSMTREKLTAILSTPADGIDFVRDGRDFRLREPEQVQRIDARLFLRLQTNPCARIEAGVNDGGSVDFISTETPYPSLGLPLQLSFGDELHTGFPRRIYSIILEFSANAASVIREISPISVPILMHKTEGGPGTFGKVYDLLLPIEMVIPRPVHLQCRVMYSGADGVTFESPLQGLDIHFQDLFLPPEGNALEEQFLSLWEELGDALESVRLLLIPAEVVLSNIEAKLSRFVAASYCKGDPGYEALVVDEEESWCTATEAPLKMNHCTLVTIRLPPRYSLLFKFSISQTSTVVKIRTDRVEALAEIDIPGFF